MARDVMHDFAAAGGMADMHRVPEVEVLDDRGDVGGIVVHVVAIADLARASMATAVMRGWVWR